MVDRPKILIADDERDNISLLKEALTQCCPESDVECVYDGEELLEYLAKKSHPNLILLDLFMPRLNGYEALAEIKRDDKLKQIPVIVLSLASRGAEVLKAYRLEANGYIQKPAGHTEFKDFVVQFKKLMQEIPFPAPQ